MKVVLDTNVFISGIFWEKSDSGGIIDAWIQNKFILIISQPILDELLRTLRTFKIQLGEEIIQGWKTAILENSEMTYPITPINIVTDPDDNKFFEAALSANAACIVSQDKHLLKV